MIRCAHGDTATYPLAWVELTIDGVLVKVQEQLKTAGNNEEVVVVDGLDLSAREVKELQDSDEMLVEPRRMAEKGALNSYGKTCCCTKEGRMEMEWNN